MVSVFQNIKENENIPKFRRKVSDVLHSGDKSTLINPFLNRNGKMVNPYINYQKVLNNPAISTQAKNFIQQATGLRPTISNTPASNGRTVRPSDAGNSTQASTTENNIVNAAQKYLGTPYVWGGESMAEGGMDCSGFVYNALKDAGYNVTRTTAQGYRNYGTSVSRTDMQPGDLVFFGKNGSASHVGIYLGNGQMIHSSGGSKNTVSNPGKGVSVTNVGYRDDFLEARRY